MTRLVLSMLLAASALCRADDDLASTMLAQVARCWSPPVKQATRGEQLKVTFEIALNLDGSIAQPPQLSANPLVAAGDPVARATAESARRAIWECSPYKLPLNRYEQWRDIVMSFDASALRPQ